MHVLIVFGTTEGQTRKISEYTASHICDQHHFATVCNSAEVTPKLNVGEFDAVIVAASVHQECHQESVTDFVIAHRAKLEAKPTAFISVSLSAAMEQGKADAQRYVDHFTTTTTWNPNSVLLLGGALRFGEYDYFKQQIVKHIVMGRESAATPDKVQDHEFTDWLALTRFTDEFLALALERTPNP